MKTFDPNKYIEEILLDFGLSLRKQEEIDLDLLLSQNRERRSGNTFREIIFALQSLELKGGNHVLLVPHWGVADYVFGKTREIIMQMEFRPFSLRRNQVTFLNGTLQIVPFEGLKRCMKELMPCPVIWFDNSLEILNDDALEEINFVLESVGYEDPSRLPFRR